jgi:hypothetical protein
MPIISGDIMTIRFAKLAIAAAAFSLAGFASAATRSRSAWPAVHRRLIIHGREYA